MNNNKDFNDGILRKVCGICKLNIPLDYYDMTREKIYKKTCRFCATRRSKYMKKK